MITAARERMSFADAVEALASLIDVRDAGTAVHAAEVSQLSRQVALALRCGPREARFVAAAGRLHDMGKAAVPDTILGKPGELSETEWISMRRHPALGAEVIGLVPPLRELAPLVRSHHERLDGSGYPDGLRGEAIPLGARIIAVADAFSAMTSMRPYRIALSPRAAIEELHLHSGTQFDAEVVAAFELVLSDRSLCAAGR